MSKIKLCVFDVAGTTLEDKNIVNDAFYQSFLDYEIPVNKSEIDQVMGMSKPEAIKIILSLKNKDLVLVEFVHKKFIQKMINFYQNDPSVKEISGTSETFKKLKSMGIKVALDTGFSRDIMNVILERTNWTKNNLVDCVVCSDEVKNGRPHPDMIQKIMSELNITNSEEIAKIGDTISDIDEGLNANCGLVAGVLTGTCSQEDFETQFDWDADFLILKSLNKIFEFLE